jgi:hypothetical protein
MSLDAAAVLDLFTKVESHALKLALFERVNTHEPKNAPGKGLSAAIWVQRIGPAPTDSGLAATTARIELRVRIYSSMLQEPQDSIDPNILAAVVKLLEQYSEDFTLGGTIRNVDVLGQTGEPLGAQAGYINQDGKMMRVMDITLPLIVNDVWTQAP